MGCQPRLVLCLDVSCFRFDIGRLIEGALYENEYVKEDGKWKIKVLRYRPQWHATFEKGTPPLISMLIFPIVCEWSDD
jgi:SnoaL-like domain